MSSGPRNVTYEEANKWVRLSLLPLKSQRTKKQYTFLEAKRNRLSKIIK